MPTLATAPTPQTSMNSSRPAPQPRPAQPLVAVGDLVVELEIERPSPPRWRWSVRPRSAVRRARSTSVSTARCTSTPSAPTSAKEMKRSGSSPPNTLSSSSPPNCASTSTSSLLSPATRSRNRQGISITRSGAGALSARSSRILNPCPVSRGASVLEQRARQHEEAAHRIGEPHRQEALRQPDAAVRQRVAPAAGEPGAVAALDVAAADREVGRAAAQRLAACRAAGSRRAAGRRRSPRRTAAEEDSAPSITAEARPRRPMRRMQRTRGSVWAIRRTSAAVPSGLLSSTNTTSQAMP